MMPLDQSIQVFVTGGTFDKTYDYINGTLNFKETHLPQMLDRSRCKLDVDVKTLMLLDSLELTSDHFKTIIEACETSERKQIVITHGTDCMVDTAMKIATEANAIENKTIIKAVIPASKLETIKWNMVLNILQIPSILKFAVNNLGDIVLSGSDSTSNTSNFNTNNLENEIRNLGDKLQSQKVEIYDRGKIEINDNRAVQYKKNNSHRG
jgi:hypothetical protein